MFTIYLPAKKPLILRQTALFPAGAGFRHQNHEQKGQRKQRQIDQKGIFHAEEGGGKLQKGRTGEGAHEAHAIGHGCRRGGQGRGAVGQLGGDGLRGGGAEIGEQGVGEEEAGNQRRPGAHQRKGQTGSSNCLGQCGCRPGRNCSMGSYSE